MKEITNDKGRVVGYSESWYCSDEGVEFNEGIRVGCDELRKLEKCFEIWDFFKIEGMKGRPPLQGNYDSNHYLNSGCLVSFYELTALASKINSKLAPNYQLVIESEERESLEMLADTLELNLLPEGL
ncbi:hypothetical protein HOD75_01485 [archaeon]|jgi:hypothetical protein|nr:hypothetical protein [archaeon]MBT4241550.1 hypothetical protein [archaeon]MBT4417578.1 hypothetical protein [archaeon]